MDFFVYLYCIPAMDTPMRTLIKFFNVIVRTPPRRREYCAATDYLV